VNGQLEPGMPPTAAQRGDPGRRRQLPDGA
jgi:hypothetical protein